MRETIYKNAFKKQYKLMKLRGKNVSKLKDIITMLANDLPLPYSYKDHTLTGNFSHFRKLHIEPDWLLIYSKKASKKDYPNGILYLESTGTHSDLF